MFKSIPVFLIGLSILIGPLRLLHAQMFMTQEEALHSAFPNGERVVRQTLFLTDTQVADIQKQARSKLESKLVVYYRASLAEKFSGCAFFETAIVRTKPATLMVVVNPDSSLRLVKLLSFYEPQDYLPAPRWLKLFENKFLTAGLWPQRDIHHISGATLSVQALTLAVRRVLATYMIAASKEPKP